MKKSHVVRLRQKGAEVELNKTNYSGTTPYSELRPRSTRRNKLAIRKGETTRTPNAPYRAARIKDERWRSAGPGFEPGRAGPRLS
jgi:hypothetical protein